jgi:hypothetical protein
VVDDRDASRKKVEAEGGQFFMKLPALPGVDAESRSRIRMVSCSTLSGQNTTSSRQDNEDGASSLAVPPRPFVSSDAG